MNIYILLLLFGSAEYQPTKSDPNNRSIYITRKDVITTLRYNKINLITKCHARGSFPGKRVFFGGLFIRKWGLASFGVYKCLKITIIKENVILLHVPIQITGVLRRRKHFSYTILLLFLEVENESVKTD